MSDRVFSSEEKARLSKGLDAAAKSDIKKALQSQIGNRGFGKTLMFVSRSVNKCTTFLLLFEYEIL